MVETKRHFSDILGAVRHNRERFIIERNGTPVAALVPLSDLEPPESNRPGFLALVGAFTDAPELPDLVDAAVASRERQPSRPAPPLGS